MKPLEVILELENPKVITTARLTLNDKGAPLIYAVFELDAFPGNIIEARYHYTGKRWEQYYKGIFVKDRFK